MVLEIINQYLQMERPWVLLLIVPLALLVYHVMKKDFVNLKEDPDIKIKRLRTQKLMIVTRTLLLALILIAIASPFWQHEKVIEGDVVLKILIDNSSSMGILEQIPHSMIEQLKRKITVETKYVGGDEVSDLGDAVLNSLESYDSVLLISDGYATRGNSLADVVAIANRLNSSINAADLKPKTNDVSISVSGPSKTMSDVENTYTIHIKKAGRIQTVPVIVTIDGEVVFSGETTDNVININKALKTGFHRIEAKTNLKDHFSQNNEFYKTVNVVPRPKILFVTHNKDSPMIDLMDQVVKIDTVTTLPRSGLRSYLDDYYAVVINNIPGAELNDKTSILQEYLNEGNGMIVFGGTDSYSDGLYRGSLFETLLPVFVGKAGRKESDINVVIVIDVSGSTGATSSTGVKAVDVEKALALTALKSLRPNIKVGVIKFNTQASVVSEFSYLFEKSQVEERIERISHSGGTLISSGLLAAINMLESVTGSKNIILISDGKTRDPQTTFEASKYAANKGIKVYAVYVSEEVAQTGAVNMMQIAEITNGVFFKASEATRLKLLFGDLEQQDVATPSLVILNKNHFITENLEDIHASIHGYNDVVPKTTARLLITTGGGDPILSAWRVGLGRVAALSTDDGSIWAADMLSKKNSKILIRTLNWAMGEPDRKASQSINIEDTRINQPTEIIIRSEKQPVSKDYDFRKIDENVYSASATPKTTGFQSVLNAIFSSNYPFEYQFVGFNPELKHITLATGGRIFSPSDIDGIIEHVKSKSKRIITSKEVQRWPFILAAMILFLLEIFARRILRKE